MLNWSNAMPERPGRDTRDMVFYLAFARFKVEVIVQQIYYRYAHGLTQDARFATMPRRVAILIRSAPTCAEGESL